MATAAGSDKLSLNNNNNNNSSNNNIYGWVDDDDDDNKIEGCSGGEGGGSGHCFAVFFPSGRFDTVLASLFFFLVFFVYWDGRSTT